MADLNHLFGNDIVAASNGDCSSVINDTLTQQRIIRRLLTDPGDYIWHTDYGAGVRKYVGAALSADLLQKISGLIRGQMLLEQGVAQSPAPVINATPIQGGLFVDIQYFDATQKTLKVLNFTVTN